MSPDALARIEDPAERGQLAFKLFDSKGVALVNPLRLGCSVVDQMRSRTRMAVVDAQRLSCLEHPSEEERGREHSTRRDSRCERSGSL